MSAPVQTTVVTAGDRAFAWGALILAASMRRNGMPHPMVVGAMDWPDEMKRRILSLGGVTVKDVPHDRRCIACQKPLLMGCDEVETEWVCWADADGAFVGDCGEWLVGDDPEEIVVRKYDPPPPDFTDANMETWRRDVERCCGQAREKRLYETRVNNPFIVLHRKWRPFLERWRAMMLDVLPNDVEIVMAKGTAYFQTDESVLGALLCFDPGAPRVAVRYKANGSADPARYYAHFAYNPKPWQMWNAHALRWRDTVKSVVDWLLEKGVVRPGDLPLPLRDGWWPLCRRLAPAAPWVWRAIKLKRRLFRR